MSRQPTGPAPPPTVQRLRVRYAKRDRLRFTSHRDFARAFERALRRAALPIAYSAGFSPHPKVSYAGAAPTGVASEAEYLEIGLAERRDPERVRAALDAALPAGLDVLAVVEGGDPPLADRLTASWWRIELPSVGAAAAAAAVSALLECTSARVERLTKNGLREIDVRPALISLRVDPPATPEAPTAGLTPSCATIDLVVQHSTPAVRPDDVLTALRTAAGLTTPVTPRVTRLAQGLPEAALPEDGPRLRDPLDDLTADPVLKANTVPQSPPASGAAAVAPS